MESPGNTFSKIYEHNNNSVAFFQVKKLPKVNRYLAEKLMAQTEDATIKKKKKVEAQNVLADDRFSAMFERPEFQVDMESDEYRLLNPLVSQIDKVSSFTWKQRVPFVNLLVCCLIRRSLVRSLSGIDKVYSFLDGYIELIFTARVRSTREGNNLTRVCLSVCPHVGEGWYPHPTFTGGGGGEPLSLKLDKVPLSYPHPLSGCIRVLPISWIGVSPPPVRWDGVLPKQNSEYLLRAGKYASCIHEGELCCFFISFLCLLGEQEEGEEGSKGGGWRNGRREWHGGRQR